VLLAVDIGNTQTHIGAFRGDELVEHWRFATVRESTADELGAALRNLLALRGLGFDDLDASVASSTVPELGPEWVTVATRYLGHEMLLVGPGVKTGMPIRMENPRELGPDRLVNAVAAYERVQGACIVVDFGTANTFDVVSATGEYLGGIIALGVEISLEALFERACGVIPGGVNSPVRAFGSVGGTPYFVARAAGCHIWDVEGRRYTDYVQSWGASILGHAHPTVVEAVQRAAADGTSYGAPTEREVLLAEAASDVDQRVLFRTGREVHGSRHLDDHPLVRNFSRNTNFWILPVAVTGISERNSTRSGTFQMASLLWLVR